MYGIDDIEEEFYGQATSDGQYDDVETYGEAGTEGHSATRAGSVPIAWGIVALALVGLWLMGAFIFKGSNQS